LNEIGKFENNLYEGSGTLTRADGHKFKGRKEY